MRENCIADMRNVFFFSLEVWNTLLEIYEI